MFEQLDPRYLKDFQLLQDQAAQLGCTVNQGYRSPAQSEIYYRQWTQGLRPGPVAPPCQSYHNYGLAVDLTGEENALQALGAWWESLPGHVWGGHFRGTGMYDPVHFEVHPPGFALPAQPCWARGPSPSSPVLSTADSHTPVYTESAPPTAQGVSVGSARKPRCGCCG